MIELAFAIGIFFFGAAVHKQVHPIAIYQIEIKPNGEQIDVCK